MASTYSNLGIELIGDGDQEGSWGDTTNDNLGYIDAAISQQASVALSGASSTLTLTNGVTSDARKAYLKFTGTPGADHTVTIAPNDLKKLYYIENAVTDGSLVIISQGTGNSVTVSPSTVVPVYCDGAGAGAAVVPVGPVTSTVLSFTVIADDMYVGGTPAEDAYDTATLTTRSIHSFDFQDTTAEYAFFMVPMPDDWDEGTVTFSVTWSPDNAATGGVRWALMSQAFVDGFDWDNTAWGTAVGVTDTATATKTTHITGVSNPVTMGGSGTAGDLMLFSIYRAASHADDTMANDAKLHAVKIYYSART